ncbi:ParA family protein [Nocardia yunnanensis]|uniref:ParA family protein n=1 Tax=Nocardia yunnanensis TaxID=2382165 RepID=A0A386ZMX9_9NOCA|nr:ParA family protein [Nocardia yunnanensis]
MLVFSASDKGGTGRSVTSCNMAYWLSMKGYKVAYLDFDFGSPTAGGTFEISRIDNGVRDGSGLHSYLLDDNGTPARVSVRSETDRMELSRSRHPSGRLVLFPGDLGGSEFTTLDHRMIDRCAALFATCEQEFDVSFVDLSAGRSIALALALSATRQLERAVCRWLIFHRWTRQHIAAAHGLVHDDNGVLATGVEWGHDRAELLNSLRYIRTAVPELNAPAGLRPAQAAWLKEQHNTLTRAANRHGMGESGILGKIPVEPMLQCREQVILDVDVAAHVANVETVAAFRELTEKLMNDAVWEQVEVRR